MKDSPQSQFELFRMIGFKKPDLGEHRVQVLMEPIEFGSRRQRRFPAFPLTSTNDARFGVLSHTQFVTKNLHGHCQIQRGVIRARGYMDELMAPAKVIVRKPGLFGAQHDCHIIAGCLLTNRSRTGAWIDGRPRQTS